MKNNPLIFIICLVSLAGCSFHLRGHETLPAPLQQLYVKTNNPYSSLTKQLRQILQSAGVILVSTADAAPVTLQILGESDGRQVTSQGVSGQLITYLLSYHMVYQLLDKHGRVIQGPQTITATRSYVVNANQLLGDISVQQNLENDMRREAINQLLQRFYSKNTLQALSNLP